MKSLNLPPFEYKVKKQNGQIWIFDIIRKRYVVLTPEEWVRQHFIHFLIESKGYPARLIAVEKEIQVCGMKRRFDLVCYDRQAVPTLSWSVRLLPWRYRKLSSIRHSSIICPLQLVLSQ